MRDNGTLTKKFFLTLILGTFSSVAFANSPAGTVVLVKGEVLIKDKGSKTVASTKDGSLRPIKPGAPFFVGEKIVTGSDGRVKLKFVDGGNEVVLGTGTELLIESAATAAKSAGTSLKLAQGEIRSSVNKKYSGQGDDVFQVKTANAVAGVRGTVFTSMFKNGESKFGTEQGAVFVGNAAGQGVLVTAGQMTIANAVAVAPPKPLESDPEMAKAVEQNGGGDNKSDKEKQDGGSEKQNGDNGKSEENGNGDQADSKGEKKSEGNSAEPAKGSESSNADKGDNNGGPKNEPANAPAENSNANNAPAEKSSTNADKGGPSKGPSGPAAGPSAAPTGGEGSRAPASTAMGPSTASPPPRPVIGTNITQQVNQIISDSTKQAQTVQQQFLQEQKAVIQEATVKIKIE